LKPKDAWVILCSWALFACAGSGSGFILKTTPPSTLTGATQKRSQSSNSAQTVPSFWRIVMMLLFQAMLSAAIFVESLPRREMASMRLRLNGSGCKSDDK
jgi:hypothetical protein